MSVHLAEFDKVVSDRPLRARRGNSLSRKPNGRGWTMGRDRELIVLAKIKGLMPSQLIFNVHQPRWYRIL